MLGSRKNTKDITEVNRMLPAFLDQAKSPLIVSTLKGRYVYVNEAYEKLRGMEKHLLIGKYWWQTFPDKEIRRFLKNSLRIVLKKQIHKYRLEYHVGTERSVYVDWLSEIFNDPVNGRQFICEQGWDTTSEVIMQNQLIHSQKIESLGILAGGIAHEFNNILTSIVGYTSFLKHYIKEDTKVKNYISKIQKAALGAAGLTSKLLGFARKGKCIEKLVDINTIVEEVIDIIKPTFSKNIDIQTELATPMFYILAVYDQIYQSIMNLLINSKDAMEQGGEIVIKTSVLDYPQEQKMENFIIPAGRYVSLSVTDSGPGMEPAVKEHIFEPFFTTKRSGQGTGLGLSMVYGTVKTHKGFILVDTSPGKGTRFELIFPAISMIKKLAESDDSGFFPISSEFKKGTILIVDDDREILEYLQAVLQEYGYEVLRAGNGEEAVGIYRERAADINLLLLDIYMPVMDGEKVAEILKKKNPDLKIIMITSCSKDETINKIKSLGVNYFLFKPFKISSLMNIISKIENNEELFDA